MITKCYTNGCTSVHRQFQMNRRIIPPRNITFVTSKEKLMLFLMHLRKQIFLVIRILKGYAIFKEKKWSIT